MRTVEEHAGIIAGLLSPMPVIEMALSDAVGLVLGDDLLAPLDLPPFDNSAMDGYAVRAVDLPAFQRPCLSRRTSRPAGRTSSLAPVRRPAS